MSMGNRLCRDARVASVLFAVIFETCPAVSYWVRKKHGYHTWLHANCVCGAAQARSPGSLRPAFRPSSRPPFPSSSKALSLPRRAVGVGAACGWIRGARTSPARGPPRRVARRLCAPAAEAKTSKAARGAWAPRSASSACPYHSAERRAPQAAEPGRRAGYKRPKAWAGPGSESRAGPRARRPPRTPGPDSLPPRRLQGPRVKRPTQCPGAQGTGKGPRPGLHGLLEPPRQVSGPRTARTSLRNFRKDRRPQVSEQIRSQTGGFHFSLRCFPCVSETSSELQILR